MTPVADRPPKDASHPAGRPVLVALGQVIRTRRRQANLSQDKLAELAHCDRQSINRLENARFVPSLVRLVEVAAALHVPVSQMFREAEELIPDTTPNGDRP